MNTNATVTAGTSRESFASHLRHNVFGQVSIRVPHRTIAPTGATTNDAAAPHGVTPEVATALGDLLSRYVRLLDGSWHDGWSVDEEAAVRHARAVLAQAGWSGRLPREVQTSLRLHLDLNLTL